MQKLIAPIVHVTVAEDRAFVRRQTSLTLSPGSSRWCLAEVSPVIVDKSLAVHLRGSAQLVSTQVVRKTTRIPKPAPPASAEIPPKDTVEFELLRDEIRSAEALYHELLMMIQEQSAWGKATPDQWDEQLEEIMRWKEELEQRQLSLMAPPATPRPKVFPKLDSAVRSADVLVDLHSPAGGDLDLVLEYCVPLATWRPYHQAEFLDNQVHFLAQASVWQNTGEDWNEVELVLSTQRQSLGSVPPPVPADYLNTRKRNGEIVVHHRDVAVQTLATSPSDEIPGIDDGGQVFNARVSGCCSVPSDGYAVRVPLFDFTCPAGMHNLLAAEICPQPVQLTRLINASRWPLLAGPVDLIREAGWVGRTLLPLVAPGEGFQLGWGPQTSLRATRSSSQSTPERDDLLGGWMRTRTQTTLTLSNLSAHTQCLEVVERVPISEIKQVEVSVDIKSMQPPTRPDEHGFLRWTLELGPRSKTVVEAGYWMRRRKEVVSA